MWLITTLRRLLGLVDADVATEARRTWHAAADLLRERAEFEMADTEGSSLERFHRTRPLHELELDFRSRAGRVLK